eukprot:402109-Rhodomonas_salina.1
MARTAEGYTEMSKGNAAMRKHEWEQVRKRASSGSKVVVEGEGAAGRAGMVGKRKGVCGAEVRTGGREEG